MKSARMVLYGIYSIHIWDRCSSLYISVKISMERDTGGKERKREIVGRCGTIGGFAIFRTIGHEAQKLPIYIYVCTYIHICVIGSDTGRERNETSTLFLHSRSFTIHFDRTVASSHSNFHFLFHSSHNFSLSVTFTG